MLFTELNTDALLHIYRYLDPIDSINLAETCTKLQDVAQLHYKRFKIFNLPQFISDEKFKEKRHNCIDAITVLKHIGPSVRDLETYLDANSLRSDVGTAIMKYCVNVKTLKINETHTTESLDPFTPYSDWLKKLNLTKISLSIRDLFLTDLSWTNTLEELHIIYSCCSYCPELAWVDYGVIADVFDRNVNISSLRISLVDDFKYEIFEKLGCFKHLVLDINYGKSEGHLEKVSANLKMAALEKVELKFQRRRRLVDGLNEFLQKLSENAIHLKHLSIEHMFAMLDTNSLSLLQSFNLASLRLIDERLNFYNDIPKVQPNLTHLHLKVCDGDLTFISLSYINPTEQIIFLIKNLEKLEILHIELPCNNHISLTLKDFLQESVLSRIFDFHSINRPTMILRFVDVNIHDYFVELKIDFRARKWTWTYKRNTHKSFVEHQSAPPFCYEYAETLDNFLVVKRFSGSEGDLNSVTDEVIKCVDKLRW